MATKDRHRINIWITPETYQELIMLKNKTGISMNTIAQVAVADKVTRLIVTEGLTRVPRPRIDRLSAPGSALSRTGDGPY